MRLCSWLMTAATLLVVQAPIVRGQETSQDRRAHTQFDNHDRQVTTDWYNQHKDHPPAGLRQQDRLSPDQERRLEPGKPVPSDLRRREHAVPSDLSHQLPPPPPKHRYVTIGGHVGLVDQTTHVLRDLIHLHS